MAPTLSSTTFKRDVRSPLFVGLQPGASIRGLRVLSLIALDTLLLCLAWAIAEHISTHGFLDWSRWNLSISAPWLAIELGVLVAGGFYRAGEFRRNYLGLIKALTLAELLLLLIAYFYQPTQLIARSRFLLFWLLSIVFIVTGRYLIDYSIKVLRQNGVIRYPVMLIADAEDLKKSLELIRKENRYNIVEVRDARALDADERERTFARIRQLGVAEAFVSWDAIRDRLFLCWQFQSAGISLHVIPIGLETLFQRSRFWVMGDFPALSFAPPMMTSSDFWIKRIFDFCSALVFLIVFSPLYCAIAVLIRLDSSGPVFYRQTRIGLHGRPFKAWKFRTMVVDADKLQKELEARNEMKDGVLFKMKDDPRVTKVGKILRQYSLDELPQLFNVLFGEMSLVGPRPLPLRDVERFSKDHLVRHEVLPGITGLWQVSGRSEIDNFEEVIQLDLNYIQNWSLGLDLKILLKTVMVVLQKTGAY